MGLGFLIPEASSAPPNARKRYLRWSSVAGLSAGVSVGMLTALHDEDVPYALIMAIAAVLIIAAVAATREFIILMRSLDELQSRIHMTALAIGFGLTAIFVVLWEALSFVAPVPAFEALLVFPIGIAGYYAALHLVSRRYR